MALAKLRESIGLTSNHLQRVLVRGCTALGPDMTELLMDRQTCQHLAKQLIAPRSIIFFDIQDESPPTFDQKASAPDVLEIDLTNVMPARQLEMLANRLAAFCEPKAGSSLPKATRAKSGIAPLPKARSSMPYLGGVRKAGATVEATGDAPRLDPKQNNRATITSRAPDVDLSTLSQADLDFLQATTRLDPQKTSIASLRSALEVRARELNLPNASKSRAATIITTLSQQRRTA